MEVWYEEEMDRRISEAWLSSSKDVFAPLLYLILSENVSVDYQVHTVSVQCDNAICDVHCDQ